MITVEQYVGPHADSPDWTTDRQSNATKLLFACSQLELEMIADGVEFPDNPATGSGVSGQTFGGFRPQDCPEGAPHSSHKEGLAVDRFDPLGAQDDWITANPDALERHGLYREAPESTNGWCHLTTRAPKSGHRTFLP